MYVLKITEAAKKDISRTIDWYNKEKTNLGYEFLEEINQNFKIIQQHPRAFQVKYVPYHEAPLNRFPYIIIYIIHKQSIIIKSIMSVRQNPAIKYSR